MLTKNKPWWRMILIVGAILLTIKSIIVDFGGDSEYAITMSYRLIEGDKMFLQMWEPHQTSAWLIAVLLWLYQSITGTLTGCALYLQLMGTLFHALISFALWKVIRSYVNENLAFLMVVFYFVCRPKDLQLPEFSNMQLWFSTLLLLCLLLYLKYPNRKRYLFGAGLFISLEIVAYPSAIVVYPLVLLFIWKTSASRKMDCLLLSLECLICGCIYIGYFVIRSGWETLLESLTLILQNDTSHSTGLAERLAAHGRWLAGMVLLLGMLWILSIFIVWGYAKLSRRFFPNKDSIVKRPWIVFLFFCLILCHDFFLVFITGSFVLYQYYTFYIPIFILCFAGWKYCSKEERQFVVAGLLIACGSCIASILLSNMRLPYILKYGILGIMVAFLPIVKLLNFYKHELGSLIYNYTLPVFCGLIILRSGIIILPMDGDVGTIFSIHGIVKHGPVVGIITNYMGAYMKNSNYQDVLQYIEEDDKVLIVKGGGCLEFLAKDVEIAAPSTISTPTYDENLLTYWTMYPDKFPTVIVIDCWYGELHISEDSWIMRWIEDEYQPNSWIDGKYLRFYRREQAS